MAWSKQGKIECSLRGSYSALPNIKKKKKQKNSATATYIEALRWKSNHVERVIAVKGSHQAMVVGIKFNIQGNNGYISIVNDHKVPCDASCK